VAPLFGAWAFFIGLVLAIGAGVFAPQDPMITLVLGAIGLVIGVVNVSGRETVEFLVAAIAFTVSPQAASPASLPGLRPQWALRGSARRFLPYSPTSWRSSPPLPP